MGFDQNSSPDLGFAFNNSDFSNRVLRIKIVADPTGSEACQTLVDCGARRKSKRCRGDVANKENEGDKVGEGRSSDERVLRVETFHVCSLLLASNSPFFFKLFSNGMMESRERCVTLKIDVSEEAALMEVLNFMYSNSLRANTATALLDVLVAADKFEVNSCMRHCCRLLRDTAMNSEFALLCLELPTNILKSEAVKPLIDAANQFLASCYKDVLKHKDEIMNLPLVGIEAILSSDDLQVPSEDSVYDMALKWTEIHYQKDEERRDILCNRLSRYLRFSYMSLEKLRKVLTCNYFNKDFATKAVLDAMFFKSDNSHSAVEDSDSTNHLFSGRAYIFRPIKVLGFELPRQHSVVYLDLKREECVGMCPSGRIFFQTFALCGHECLFKAKYMGESQCFGLIISVKENASATFVFNCLVSARSKASEEYITMCKNNYNLAPGNATRYRSWDLFTIPWTLFVADDSPYFINEVFQIRAEITVKH